mmetsp:Transcript_2927/g.8947  ORF Transcript_2927/g.8947 Transcript_2927/m.8947 type:complete len:281 (-) Transcript_2927:2809-3651(-)
MATGPLSKRTLARCASRMSQQEAPHSCRARCASWARLFMPTRLRSGRVPRSQSTSLTRPTGRGRTQSCSVSLSRAPSRPHFGTTIFTCASAIASRWPTLSARCRRRWACPTRRASRLPFTSRARYAQALRIAAARPPSAPTSRWARLAGSSSHGTFRARSRASTRTHGSWWPAVPGSRRPRASRPSPLRRMVAASPPRSRCSLHQRQLVALGPAMPPRPPGRTPHAYSRMWSRATPSTHTTLACRTGCRSATPGMPRRRRCWPSKRVRPLRPLLARRSSR